MTPASFSVLVTARFKREYRKIVAAHPEIAEHYRRVVEILSVDTHNRSRRYPIKKMTGVQPCGGLYRICFLRFRFIYDIASQFVCLKYCGLRREDTYK